MEPNNVIRCIEIREKLLEKIKGKIFITISDGQLSICITGFRGVRFRKYFNDVPKWLDNNKIVNDIVYEYKQFILDNFMYQKGVY